jgi:hypothetical protein
MIDDISSSVSIVTMLKDAILGPTGGLMAICFAIGSVCGWRFSEKVLVKKYVDEVNNLKAILHENEENCRKEIDKIEARLRAVEDSRVAILSNHNKPHATNGLTSF